MRIVTASLIVATSLCYAFVPFASTAQVRTSRRGRLVAWSTTSPDSRQNTRKLAAVESLEKLLKRQASEIEDTERLLKRLKNWEEPGDDDQSSSHASSLLSGFDYGFISRSEGASFSGLKGGLSNPKGTVFEEYGPPANIVALGIQQFRRNWDAIQGEYKDEADIVLTDRQLALQAKLEQLTLNSTAIWERELAEGPIEAPLIIKVPYLVLCWFLDGLFEGKNVFSRFFLLETVARMPYFSYINMLHLYETLGFWRRSSDVKRIHFAEEWNEFNHLLIMESLGGDQQWWVRFVAQHSAIVYYFVLCHLWALSPSLAYKFSELLESHAVNTYGGLLIENEELLKELPPSIAAIEYYSLGGSDPFFAEYQTSALNNGSGIRKPGDNMQSLYDVFRAIQADEGDHVGAMKACLDPSVAVQSPSVEKRVLIGAALVAAYALSDFDSINSINDLVDSGGGLDGLVDGLSAESLIDAAMVGGAALMNQVAQDREEQSVLGLAGDFFEAGFFGAVLESARLAIVQVLVWLAAIVRALVSILL